MQVAAVILATVRQPGAHARSHGRQHRDGALMEPRGCNRSQHRRGERQDRSRIDTRFVQLGEARGNGKQEPW